MTALELGTTIIWDDFRSASVTAIIAATTRCGLEGLSIESNVRRLLDVGFEHIVLHAGVRPHAWENLSALVRRGVVVAAHHPTPASLSRGVGATDPRPGSLDADERRELVNRVRQSIEFLDRNDIPLLVLPPVTLDEPDVAAVLEAMGSRDEALERLIERRDSAELTQRQLESFLRALDAILAHADRYGRRVAIVPAGLPCELPGEVELGRILEELAGAPLDVMADMVRFERHVEARGRTPWPLDEGGDRIAGVIVHDGDASRARLPLGEGRVELERWSALARAATSRPLVWSVDLSRHAGESDIAGTDARLRALLTRDDARRRDAGSPFPFLDSVPNDLV